MARATRQTDLMLPDEVVINKIYLIRGQKVMLDRDLAELYGVETKVLNQAVKRNSERFPKDFMFQLMQVDWESLRSQFVTLENGRGKYPKDWERLPPRPQNVPESLLPGTGKAQ